MRLKKFVCPFARMFEIIRRMQNTLAFATELFCVTFRNPSQCQKAKRRSIFPVVHAAVETSEWIIASFVIFKMRWVEE